MALHDMGVQEQQKGSRRGCSSIPHCIRQLKQRVIQPPTYQKLSSSDNCWILCSSSLFRLESYIYFLNVSDLLSSHLTHQYRAEPFL